MDDIYMTAVQALTGRGGWPSRSCSRPTAGPSSPGRTSPARTAAGMPGFTSCWRHVGRRLAATGRRVEEQADRRRCSRGRQRAPPAGRRRPARASRAPLDAAVAAACGESSTPPRRLRRAPKFPAATAARAAGCTTTPHTGDPALLDMVLVTLDAWRAAASTTTSAAGSTATPPTRSGSCRTSRRCSTTTPSWPRLRWRRTAPRATTTTPDVRRRDVRLRPARHDRPGGRLLLRQDADSEGEEGRYYVWTGREILAALGPDDGGAVLPRLRRQRGRQLPRRGPGRAPGTNIVHLERPLDEMAVDQHVAASELRRRLAGCRAGCWRARKAARPPAPGRQGAGRLERADDRRAGLRRGRPEGAAVTSAPRPGPPTSSWTGMRRERTPAADLRDGQAEAQRLPGRLRLPRGGLLELHLSHRRSALAGRRGALADNAGPAFWDAAAAGSTSQSPTTRTCWSDPRAPSTRPPPPATAWPPRCWSA